MEPKYGDKSIQNDKLAIEMENPDEVYDDVAEEFLDEVFESESKLERDQWI